MKSRKTKAKTTKNKRDSITEVHKRPLKSALVFSGVRKPHGVRCDTGLYKVVKPILIARYGSVCRPWEAFLVAHLAAASDPVSLGNTVVIERLRIERNVRPRRKLDWEPYDIGFGDVDVCGVCGKPLGDVAYRVEYVSGKFDVLCSVCYKVQRERRVVERVVGKLAPK